MRTRGPMRISTPLSTPLSTPKSHAHDQVRARSVLTVFFPLISCHGGLCFSRCCWGCGCHQRCDCVQDPPRDLFREVQEWYRDRCNHNGFEAPAIRGAGGGAYTWRDARGQMEAPVERHGSSRWQRHSSTCNERGGRDPTCIGADCRGCQGCQGCPGRDTRHAHGQRCW